jgi:putative glutamine amidotransferase
VPALVGVTCDLIVPEGAPPRATAALAYATCLARAGAVPVLLPPIASLARTHAATCDAFVFTGGDDPRTEPFGVPTHLRATPLHPDRQEYETALLRVLAAEFPDKPVLGVCLGMQMMALVAGGTLDQHMPDTRADAARHWGATHPVRGEIGRGVVHSRHRQCVSDPGPLVVLGHSDDGVVEAVGDPRRAFYVGVQWHPERTEDPVLGEGLFQRLVEAACAPVR